MNLLEGNTEKVGKFKKIFKIFFCLYKFHFKKKTPTKVEVKNVEPEGFEPSSKHAIKKRSTSLVFVKF